jgi:type I restriction enzyme S subunit
VSELPQGWATAFLADLIVHDGEFSDGDWVESKDQDPNGSIRLLQLADIGDGVFLDKSNRFINEQKFDQLRCTEVLEGDVLVARMPDPLGRACLAPRLLQRCITVVDVAIVRPGHQSVHPAWLMHFLNTPADIEQP